MKRKKTHNQKKKKREKMVGGKNLSCRTFGKDLEVLALQLQTLQRKFTLSSETGTELHVLQKDLQI